MPLSDLDTHNYGRIIKFKESFKTKIDQSVLSTESSNDIGYSSNVVHKLHKQQKRFIQEEIEEIIEEYKNGAYIIELARKFGCHESTIRRQLRKAGVKD